jgi:phosphatidylglycerol:prolipoprotein diacylglycerol transferase
MHPVLFKIGPVQIYSYGAMLAAAFLAAAFLARRRAAAFGMDADTILDLCPWLIVSGLIGARLFFVILNLDYYRQSPFEVFIDRKSVV